MNKCILLLLLSILSVASYAQLEEKVGVGVRLKLDSSKGYKIPVVAGLVPGGAAEKSGLLTGDIIFEVNDRSTKNMLLDDVVNMIIGDEGTNVKIAFDRNGSRKTYNIMRGKYKYSASFYESAIKDDAFCTALTKLMNDAGYNFANTTDKSVKDKNDDFGSKVKIPGAVNTAIVISVGTTAEVDLGNFTNKDEVNVAGTAIIEKIKACFPNYYYEPVVDNKGDVSVNIGRQFRDGYEAPILQLFSWLDRASQKHKLQLRINGGKATRFYKVPSPGADNSFTTAVKKIFSDVSNDFKNVKGKKLSTNEGIFSGGTTYEITPVPDGSKGCSITEGSMSLGAKNCSCGFYQGSSRTDAVNIFNSTFEKLGAALGTDFVYTSDKSQWDMNITKAAETAVTFAIKQKKTYESNIPVIVLLLEKYENGNYAVRMLFYRVGL